MKANPRESLLKVSDGLNGAEFDVEDVLGKIGFGKAQWLLMLIGGLLTLTDIGAQQMAGIVAIASQCDFEMSQSQKGLMMGSCVAGVSLSTYIWGYVTDAVGRRTVLLYSMLWSNFFMFVSMFVTNFWVFIVMNFILGLSLGGISAAIYPFLSEFTTLKYRAVVINFVNMFVSVETICVPASAWLVLSYDWSIEVFDGFAFRPWRLIILLNLLPGFIAALLLLLVPETPKLLLSQSKNKEAVMAVDWLCQFNMGVSASQLLHTKRIILKPESIADAELMSRHHDKSMLVAIWKTTKPLFHKPHRVNYIISLVIVSGSFFSYMGIKYWFPEIVNRISGEDGANSSTVCDILDESFKRQKENATSQLDMVCDDSISTETYINSMIVGLVSVIGYIVQGILLNPLGRKNVLMATLVTSSLSGILLHFVANPTIVLILFCLFILMPGLAVSNVSSAVVDLVPTHLRGKAVSLCFTLGRLAVMVGTNLAGVMLEPLCHGTFAMFTASTLICLFLAHLLPI